MSTWTLHLFQLVDDFYGVVFFFCCADEVGYPRVVAMHGQILEY